VGDAVSRRALAFVPLAAVLATRCSSEPSSPTPCGLVTPAVSVSDDDVVWGFADLHAHPAIELAFNERLVWGTAIDDAPVDASQLPAIQACPVETHDKSATSPIDRAVGGQVFPPISALGGFAHGPVGSVDYRPTSSWPNARDVIHQQMNVASIRRAYESGLRLMFASTTDDQAIAALLLGPNVANAFVPDAHADYASARKQLDLIVKIVERNSAWMEIAKTPDDARRIIGVEKKLAIVLSVEMNGLSLTDVEQLRADYGVQHIVPIHVIDNDVGGTAANGGLFNTSTAAMSSLLNPTRAPWHYMDLEATVDWGRSVDWPLHVETLSPAPFYASLGEVPYGTYASVCYEPLAACAGSTAVGSSFVLFGQRNQHGIYDSARIQRFITEKMFVDLSHMGARAIDDTLAIASGYPLMASHGDVAHLCDGASTPCFDVQRTPMTERQPDVQQALTIIQKGGVLGFGTSMANYDARGVMAARGGPLVTITPGATRAFVTRVDPIPYDASAPIDSLQIHTAGGILPATIAQPFVRVEMRADVADERYQRHVFVEPLACTDQSCDVTIALGTRDAIGTPQKLCTPLSSEDALAKTTSGYVAGDVLSVTLEWLYLQNETAPDNECRQTWSDDAAPSWSIERATVTTLQDGVPSTIANVGDGVSVLARLHKDRGSIVVYDRDDRPDSSASVLASGKLLKVSMRSGPGGDPMAGASPQAAGANVCFSLRARTPNGCESSAAPLDASATECGAGWIPMNQRGQWNPDVLLYAFARGDETTVCGVDIAVLDLSSSSTPFTIDEVRVDAIEDPVGHWVRRYGEVAKRVASGERGRLAFGTDFNGLNGLMDISEFSVPEGTPLASVCSTTTTSLPDGQVGTLAPMRIRNKDGSLGPKVLIEERGLSTYGMLADLLAVIDTHYGQCGKDVHDSLMLSAEATIRMWEAMLAWPNPPPKQKNALPAATFDCASVMGTP
jgi:microsomal dipeptidase-like Zn-dependent dipeptidase